MIFFSFGLMGVGDARYCLCMVLGGTTGVDFFGLLKELGVFWVSRWEVGCLEVMVTISMGWNFVCFFKMASWQLKYH